MNDYEIAILYHPDLEVDLTKAEERIKKILDDAGAKLKNTDNWGKRKLAYDIKGNSHAVYVFYTATIDGRKLKEIESALNITSEVIRFLITKVDYKAIEKADKLKAIKAAKAGSEEESAEEEAES